MAASGGSVSTAGTLSVAGTDAGSGCAIPRDFYRDADGDGFGLDADTMSACEQPAGYIEMAGDCDDGAASANPNGSEICDGIDNDCENGVDVGANCPPGCGGGLFGGHMYIHCSDNVTGDTARQLCIDYGYRLVRIDSVEENDWLISAIPEAAIWIGGRDASVEGQWRWEDSEIFWQGGSDGSPVGGLYTNWASGEPNQAGEEDCAELSKSAGNAWTDRTCGSLTQPFVCEQY
jgi:hypothetical protein